MDGAAAAKAGARPAETMAAVAAEVERNLRRLIFMVLRVPLREVGVLSGNHTLRRGGEVCWMERAGGGCYETLARSIGQSPVRLLLADRHAVAATYHGGQINAQLRIHKAPLLQAEIMSAVVVSARREVRRKETRAFRNPRRTPKIAGRRNRNRQALAGSPDGTLQR